ncbi:MAG: hypothetical protein IJH94_06215, partial [Clostridia bacterium]|nr:hypothetical protein [Clostridia bacterium]
PDLLYYTTIINETEDMEMTRQKKEILKKINEIETWIMVDEELGCGFAPPGAYDHLYEEIYELKEQLAKLMHYDSVEAMYLDGRGAVRYTSSDDPEDYIPFE